jgi:hypothetical protein
LGIKQQLGSIHAFINAADSFEQAAKDVFDRFGITLILRERLFPKADKTAFPGHSYHSFQRNCPLVEHFSPDTPESAILCSPESGFLSIDPTQSVIVFSGAKSSDFFFLFCRTICTEYIF